MKQDRIDFTHDPKGQKNCFSLKYKDIAISNATTESEVQLEFQQDHEASRKGDILCEMRFYVPNIDDKILEDHEKKLEEKERLKKERK